MQSEVVHGDSEYTNLMRRKGQDYSVGHQIMYLAPILAIAGSKSRILDVGAGIGWGLRKMIEYGAVKEYVGYEPDKESYDYLSKRMKGDALKLINEPFSGTDDVFDYVFCIEVIEHVETDVQSFIEALRRATGKILYLSTPEADKSDHGRFTADDLVRRLKGAGFRDVVPIQEQWTTLYIAR